MYFAAVSYAQEKTDWRMAAHDATTLSAFGTVEKIEFP